MRRRNSSSVLASGCSASLESRLIREILQAVGDGAGGGSQEWGGFLCVCVCVSELMSQNFSLCGKHTYISCRQMQHQPRYPCVPGSWDLVPGTVQASGNQAAGLTSRLLSTQGPNSSPVFYPVLSAKVHLPGRTQNPAWIGPSTSGLDLLSAPPSVVASVEVKPVVPPASALICWVQMPDWAHPSQNLRSVRADVLPSLTQTLVECFDFLKVIFAHALRQSRC